MMAIKMVHVISSFWGKIDAVNFNILNLQGMEKLIYMSEFLKAWE